MSQLTGPSIAGASSPFSIRSSPAEFTDAGEQRARERLLGSTSTHQPNEPACGPIGTFGVIENSPDVNENYIVTIESSYLKRSIRAYQQDDFEFKIQSQWQRPGAGGSFSDYTQLAQLATQLASGKVLGNQFMTRRKWSATTPCVFTLLLKFEAVVDVNREVIIPCETLQQLVVPGSDNTTGEKSTNWMAAAWSNLTLYPPGPNPALFSFESGLDGLDAAIGKQAAHLREREDRINIKIGKFLEFKKAIVSEVIVKYKRKFSEAGRPVSAQATVTFESFEIYTKEELHGTVYRNRAITTL